MTETAEYIDNRDFSLMISFLLLRESHNVIKETEKRRNNFIILPEQMTKNIESLPDGYMDQYIETMKKEKKITDLLALQYQVKSVAMDMLIKSYEDKQGKHPAKHLSDSFDNINKTIYNFFVDVQNGILYDPS